MPTAAPGVRARAPGGAPRAPRRLAPPLRPLLLLACAALGACDDASTSALIDAAAGADGGAEDARPADAGRLDDRGLAVDARPFDARPDDAGATDVGAGDVGAADAEPGDARPTDAAERPDQGAPPPAGRWVPAPPMPEPRQETAVVAFEGEMWVIGGFDEAGRVVPDAWIYEPASATWRAGPPLPVPLHHANVAVAAGRIWVLGFLTRLTFTEDGRGYVYDPAVGAWAETTRMPAGTARGAAGMAVVDDAIYLIGGLAGGQSVAAVSRFDPQTATFTARAPLPRLVDHLAVGALGGAIHVAGGRAGGIGGHTARLDRYEPATDTWHVGPPMPTSRGGTAAAVLDDRLFVFGGEGARNQTGVFDAVEVYDPRSDAWQVLAPMGIPRHGNGAATLDGRIYVPGGARVQAFGAVSDHEAFEPPGP